MEYEYFKERMESWILNEHGSYWAVGIYEPDTKEEYLDGKPMTYYNSCKIRVMFKDRDDICYKVLVTGLGLLVFSKIQY